MVECIQNIVKHSGDCTVENGNMLIISQKEAEYHVITGNHMEQGEVCKLKDTLDYINSLSKDRLREHYIQTLKNGQISERGGAGLGFIDMVRKTGNKLSYDFKNISGDKSFFTLKNTIHC